MFLINLGRVAFAPLVPELQSSLGLSPAAVGSVTTLVWIGSALPRIPVGYLLTRVRREWVVIASGVGLTAAAAFTATANSLVTLRAGALAIGLATGGYFVAAIPLLGALFPTETGRRVGIHGAASQIAAVVAPAAVALVVAMLGDWRLAFAGLAVTAGAVTVGLVVVLRRGEPATEPPSRNFGLALKRWRTILAGLWLVTVLGFVWQGTFNFYVSYLLTGQITRETANALLTLTFAAGLPGFWLGGRLADRLPHVAYLLGINATFAVALVGLTLADGLVGVAIASIVMGLVIHAAFPAVDTYVLQTLPPAGRASAYAVFSGVALGLEATGSGVVGTLVDRGFDYGATYRLLAGVILLVVAVGALADRAGWLPTPERGDPSGASETPATDGPDEPSPFDE